MLWACFLFQAALSLLLTWRLERRQLSVLLHLGAGELGAVALLATGVNWGANLVQQVRKMEGHWSGWTEAPVASLGTGIRPSGVPLSLQYLLPIRIPYVLISGRCPPSPSSTAVHPSSGRTSGRRIPARRVEQPSCRHTGSLLSSCPQHPRCMRACS